MRILQSSIVRAVCACVVGYLLVMYRTEMLQWLTIAIGALFFVSGLISVIMYYVEKRKAECTAEQLATIAEMRDGADAPEDKRDILRSIKPTFPLVGLGSMILGAILSMMPSTFINGVMYVLAAILIFGAINQYFNLSGILKISRVPFIYWLFPTIILLAGIYMLVNPLESMAMPFRILGWCLILYGVVECINSIKIYKAKKDYEKAQQRLEETTTTSVEDNIEDAEIVE